MPTQFNRETINATRYVALDASSNGTRTGIFSNQTPTP